MRIHCTTTFLDGTVRFEKDDICTVPDADAARFIGANWAAPAGDAAAFAAATAALAQPAKTTVAVDNAVKSLKDNHA